MVHFKQVFASWVTIKKGKKSSTTQKHEKTELSSGQY